VHGVAARVGPAETAVFGLRGEHYEVSIIAAWNGGDAEPHIAWARDYWQSLEPYATGAVYINTIGDEGEERVKAAYGPNYPRLAAIKHAYDPTNFFRVNQNIRPAPGP
ncbi:MAG TPA: BBE domain-containing protein, partial [Chloroflexota bacterium]